MRLIKKLAYFIPVLIIGCASPQTTNLTSNASASPITTNSNPIQNIEKNKVANALIWEVQSPNGKNKSYLLATVHVQLDSRYNLPDKVISALKSSNKFYMEADTNVSSLDATVLSSGFSLDQDLEKDLSPELWTKLVERLKGFPGMSAQVVKVLEPWLIKSVLSSLQTPDATTTDAKKAMDNIVRQKSEDFKIAVNFLETPKDQIEALKNSKSRDGHIEDIKNILSKNDNAVGEETQAIITAYNNSDTNAILKFDKDQSLSPTEYKTLLTDRENNWYKKLDFANENIFIAVGAMHVIRSNGIIDTLKSKGFTIRML